MKFLLVGFVALATATLTLANEFANSKMLMAGSFKLADVVPHATPAMNLAAADFSQAELQKYVNQLVDCYDIDGNESLNKTELLKVVQGTLFGGECPNKKLEVDSTILGESDLANLQKWFGGKSFSLTQLYQANNSQCSGATWRKSIVGKDNILTVAKTTYGKVLGAFAKQPVDNFNTYKFIADSDVQIFSFSSGQAFKILAGQSSRAMEIWTNSNYFVDYGYDALFFYDSNGRCITRYDENTARTYFGSTVDHVQMTGYTGANSWQEVDTVAIETYQVVFN